MLNVFYLVFHVIWNALRPFLISEIKCYVQLRCRKWTTATIWNDLFDVPYLNILNILRLFHISIHQSIARFIQQISENNEIVFFFFVLIYYSWRPFTRRLILPSVPILHTKRRNIRRLPPRNAGMMPNLRLYSVRPRLPPARRLSSPNSRPKPKLKTSICIQYAFSINHFMQKCFFYFII